MNNFTHQSIEARIYEMEEPTTLEYRELKKKSSEPHILATTPRDATERFVSLTTFTAWHLDHRILYKMMINDELAGLTWFHQSPFSNLEVPSSFAIRIYEPYVGKGLAVPFMKATHELMNKNFGNETFWLGVDNNNSAARHIYTKFGYQLACQGEKRSLMVYDNREHEEQRA